MKRLRKLLPLLIAAGAIGLLFLELLTWQPHGEAPLIFLALQCLPALCVAGAAAAIYRGKWMRTALWLAALAVCLYARAAEMRIPLCTMCEGVTPEEMGWMARFLTWGP